MLNILKPVTSDDRGNDESKVQTLLKKHKEVTNELKNYSSIVVILHEQAACLGEVDRELGLVIERLSSIRCKELMEMAKIRKQRLDALSPIYCSLMRMVLSNG